MHSGQWSIFIAPDGASGDCLKSNSDGAPARVTHISIIGKVADRVAVMQREIVGTSAPSRMTTEAIHKINRRCSIDDGMNLV